jgi:hypothetical protein
LSTEPLEESLKAIVRSSSALMEALTIARELNLADWCIAAGAVRNLVWDCLHGVEDTTTITELDLIYFDPDEGDRNERIIQEMINHSHPEWIWDVTNQATVHHWYEKEFGQSANPLLSLLDGIGSWPEFPTCVGISLTTTDELVVLAPHGLTDLFSLQIRHNPARASLAVARERMLAKHWLSRWPHLKPVGGLANAA